MCRYENRHSCSGTLPVNMLGQSPKYDRKNMFLFIGMVPKNRFQGLTRLYNSVKLQKVPLKDHSC